MASYHKYKIVSLAIVFVISISFPLINNTFNLIEDSQNLENRAMANKPIFNTYHLDPFPRDYEKYYNDYFSLRSLIVRSFTTYKLRVFKKSPFPDKVIVGYNDWLYLAGNELNCYLGTNRLSDAQLEAYKEDLEFQQKYLAERGCKFYFMVIPTKANVHPENIPYNYFRFSSESIGEQLLNYLKKNSNINIISVFDSFKKIKSKEELYYKQDNHWNKKGAFYAANAVSSKIAEDINGIMPLQISDFKINETQKKEIGDIAKLLGNPDFYVDNEYDLVSKKTNTPLNFDQRDYSAAFVKTRQGKNPKKPKLMIVGDSFANLIFPFLSESFGKTVSVFDIWQYKLQDELVNTEKPDAYLLMEYEPFLMAVPDNRTKFKK